MNDTASKPLIFSRTPPVVLLAALLVWAAARIGLTLDGDTSMMLAGGAGTLAGYAMRYITKRPISGVLTTPAA